MSKYPFMSSYGVRAAVFRIEMEEFDINQLISVIEEHPLLWNRNHKDYKSRVASHRAWTHVCQILNEEFDSLPSSFQEKYRNIVLRKWKNVRDQYIKSAKRAGQVKSYIYNDQLSFLKNVVSLGTRESGGSGFEIELDQDNEDSHPSVELDVNNIKKEREGSEDTDNDNNNDDNNYHPSGDRPSSPHPSSTSTFYTSPTSKFNGFHKGPSLKKRKMADTSSCVYQNLAECNMSAREDRHMSFFKGILPSLNDLSEEEILQFQSIAINGILSIKRARRNSNLNSDTSLSQNAT